MKVTKMHTFRNSTQEMLMPQFRCTFPKRNHSRLNTNSLQLRPIEFICAPRQFLEIDICRCCHFSGVNFEDTGTGRFVRKRELDFAIETAGTEEGGVEDIDSIRCCYDLRYIQRQAFADGGEELTLMRSSLLNPSS